MGDGMMGESSGLLCLYKNQIQVGTDRHAGAPVYRKVAGNSHPSTIPGRIMLMLEIMMGMRFSRQELT